MIEPVSVTVGAMSIATAYLAKDGVNKLLGPTADYLGVGIKNFVEKQNENLANIFKRAEDILGDEIEKPGVVPPKILKKIMNDGSLSDDTVTVNYFGGVLASSRTEVGRDDRGARVSNVIESLSSYQIRAHYVLYSIVKAVHSSEGNSLSLEVDRQKLSTFVNFSEFIRSMNFDSTEAAQLSSLLPHIFHGLSRDDLIAKSWSYGDSESLISLFKDAKEPGFVFTPTAFGAEVYLWAFGAGTKDINYFFDKGFSPLEIDVEVFSKSAVATK